MTDAGGAPPVPPVPEAPMWNERYSRPGFAYGTEPNDFLAAVVHRLPTGRVLCLADGEGRNAVFLAERGFEVHGVDASSVGLAKAQALARERGVNITTEVVDLADWDPGAGLWDAIVAIWCHLPPTLRARLHASIPLALRSGGALVLEAYTPEQLEFGTGGPPAQQMLMSLEDVRSEVGPMRYEIAREIEREVHEGSLHNGRSAVVQVLGFKL